MKMESVMLNRLLVIALIFISGCSLESETVKPTHREHAIASSLLSSFSLRVDEVPTGPVLGKCEDCNGTGKVGDGRVFVDCVTCGGDGKVDEEDLKSEEEVQSPDPVLPTKTNKGTIKFYTRPGCVWCEKFKREVLPLLDDYTVIQIQDNRNAVPHFEFDFNGRKTTHRGFISKGQIDGLQQRYGNVIKAAAKEGEKLVRLPNWTEHTRVRYTFPGTIESHLRSHLVPDDIISGLTRNERVWLHDYLHNREKHLAVPNLTDADIKMLRE